MVSLEQVIKAEAELNQMRRMFAAQLKGERLSRSYSLRYVGEKINISAPGLHKLEGGQTWNSQTVTRLARFYERLGRRIALAA